MSDTLTALPPVAGPAGPAASQLTCAVDQTAHATLEDLHKHLKRLKVKQEVYYTDHAPIRDLHTGEAIPFKAPAADYLKRQFLSRTTLKGWLKANPEAGRDWALDWLAARVADKGLTAAPCQVELRSIPSPCPDIRYYEDAFDGGWATASQWAGLVPRFPLGGALAAAATLPCPVVIDTREQDPLDLPCESVRGTLKTADYGLPAAHDKGIYIERKSLSDFIGSISSRETRPGDSNLARFTRELERAEEIGAYVVMLVEAKLSDCLAFNQIPYLKRQFSHVKVTPDHLFHNLRDLLQRFPTTFQTLFVDGRPAAAATVVRLLAAGDSVKTVDLQLLLDTKELEAS